MSQVEFFISLCGFDIEWLQGEWFYWHFNHLSTGR